MKSQQLRLMILDYPIALLDNKTTSRMFSDLITEKQTAFFRTSKSFVATDRHDMIGTHILVYNTEDLYQPKLEAGVRLTYDDRAKKHNLPMPIESYFANLPKAAKDEFESFHRRYPITVDGGSWFIHPRLAEATSQFHYSEFMFSMIMLHILRLGLNNLVGAFNERYKGSKRMAEFGQFRDDLKFTHPSVPDLHKLALIESFNSSKLLECWTKYDELIENRFELVAPSISLQSVEDVKEGFRRNPESLLKAA